MVSRHLKRAAHKSKHAARSRSRRASRKSPARKHAHRVGSKAGRSRSRSRAGRSKAGRSKAGRSRSRGGRRLRGGVTGPKIAVGTVGAAAGAGMVWFGGHWISSANLKKKLSNYTERLKKAQDSNDSTEIIELGKEIEVIKDKLKTIPKYYGGDSD